MLLASHTSSGAGFRGLVAALLTCATLIASGQEATGDLPQLASHVLPPYPAPALDAGVQGDVTLEVTVRADGSVGDARVLSSVPQLDDAALAAVRQWRFAPRADRPTGPVRVRFMFTVQRSPVASTLDAGLPSWMPRHFAVQHRYQCRQAYGEVDTATRRLRVQNSPLDAQPAAAPNERAMTFGFDVRALTDLFVELVEAGFFTMDVPALSEPAVAAGVQLVDQEYVAVVAASPRLADLAGASGDAAEQELAVLRGAGWRVVRWTEPLPRSTSREVRAIADIARGLREAAMMRVEGQGIEPGDVCL